MPNKDYIERSDAVSLIVNGNELIGRGWLIKELATLPAADVEPKRKTGHWVYKSREQIHYERVTGYDIFSGDRHIIEVRKDLGGKYPHCSECDALAADSFMDYCPHCGAEMIFEPLKGEKEG